MFSTRRKGALLLALLFVLTSYAYATFPYSATWLNYADKRLVYQIDTSGITSNTANVYVTIDINSAVLQDYINRWASFCDPIGRYDWFYPTFTYASTQNTTERPLQVVSYQNWQTFTVGSCGDVNLPTRFVLLLPNGVLDGASDYGLYNHYVYAYLKYPYVEDYYDDPVGTAPAGWVANPVGYDPAASTILFTNGDLDTGHTLNITDGGALDRDISISINLDDTTPTYVCANQHSYLPDISLMVAGTWYQVATLDDYARSCVDVEPALRNAGLSGTVTAQRIRYSSGGSPINYWLWLIPEQVYRYVLSG